MLDPVSLFTWEPHIDQRRVHADTLVVTLRRDGFQGPQAILPP